MINCNNDYVLRKLNNKFHYSNIFYVFLTTLYQFVSIDDIANE